MKNVDNQELVFKILVGLLSLLMAGSIVVGFIGFFVSAEAKGDINKAVANIERDIKELNVAIENFCKKTNFDIAGFESLKKAQEDGDCELFIKNIIKSALLQQEVL